MADERSMTSEPLLRIAWGSWAADVMASGVEVGLFASLSADEGQSSVDVADRLGLALAPTEQFLAASGALGLIESAGGRWRNSAIAERFLVPGRPGYVGGFACFLRDRQQAKRVGLTDLLRDEEAPGMGGWSLPQEIDYSRLKPFWDGLHPMSLHAGSVLADVLPLADRRAVLDVGGGTGGYAIGLCERHPHLTATVYDLDFVAPWAGERIREAGLAERVAAVPGDFTGSVPLPAGHDVVLLGSVLHDWGTDGVTAILAKCHSALPEGGMVVVSELVLNEAKSGPLTAALIGLSTMMETPGGRSYSEAEHRAALEDAGFRDITAYPTPLGQANLALVAYRR